jgi:hypothetical protein
VSRRILIVLSLALALTVAVVAGPASAATSRRSAVRYNGSVSSINLTQSGSSLTDVWAGLQLPSSYANRFCAYAVLYIGGRHAYQTATKCDTNGDAYLRFYWSGTFVGYDGDQVTVWFSDPVTRYDVIHPTITL